MARLVKWRKEPGARLAGARDLDRDKVQAPCIVRAPGGGFRLLYTAVGPGRPYANCQGYILSALSSDGLNFSPEPGIRVAPHPELPRLSLRVLAPSLVHLPDGRWRLYFEARGPANLPTAICSAVSDDQLDWTIEAGMRLVAPGGVGAPRAKLLGDGRTQLTAFRRELDAGGKPDGTTVISAASVDGLSFAMDSEVLLRDRTSAYDTAGITAAEIVPPAALGEPWVMLFSAWQDRPVDAPPPPLHPSLDPAATATGRSADFAAASIATDMSGYRSRILVAQSPDGRHWQCGPVVIEGDGYGGKDIDAVHAEDMSAVALGDGRYRLYYAACDARGRWCIASAVSD